MNHKLDETVSDLPGTSFKTDWDFSHKMHGKDFSTVHSVTLKALLEFGFWDPQKNYSFNTAWDNV